MEHGQWSMKQKLRRRNEIIYNPEILKPNPYYYNEDTTLVRGNITIVEDNVTQAAFKNWASYIKCITKIDGTTMDDAEDLDLVMLMYSLLECSYNNSDTLSSLWF